MTKEETLQLLKSSLYSAKEERLNAKANPLLLAKRNSVKEFQVSRLKVTHKDLLDSPNTSKAARFFLQEIYGTKDLTQRDKDIERFIPMMSSVFPLNTLGAITKAIELDALSERLDTQMAQALPNSFDEKDYIDAFRSATSYSDRALQLQLVQELGAALCSLVQLPFLTTTLKMMKFPAKMANLSSLHNFLEEGFTTFKETSQADKFVSTLTSREIAIMERIYQNTPNPFTAPLEINPNNQFGKTSTLNSSSVSLPPNITNKISTTRADVSSLGTSLPPKTSI